MRSNTVLASMMVMMFLAPLALGVQAEVGAQDDLRAARLPIDPDALPGIRVPPVPNAPSIAELSRDLFAQVPAVEPSLPTNLVIPAEPSPGPPLRDPCDFPCDEFIDPVDVELATAAPLVLGVPGYVKVTATARWHDLSNVTVRLQVVGDGAAVLGPSMAELELKKDRPVESSFLLRFERTGTYRIEAIVSGADSIGELGGFGQGFAVFEVRDKVGAFHPTQLPSPTHAVRVGSFGPSRPGGDRGLDPGAPSPRQGTGLPLPPEPRWLDTPSSAPGPSDHPTFQATACWNYETETPGIYARQRYAYVQLWDEDYLETQDLGDLPDLLWEGLFEEDGCFVTPDLPRAEEDCCSKGNQELYLLIRACNTWVCVTTKEGYDYLWGSVLMALGSEDILDFGELYAGAIDAYPFASRVFQYALNAAEFAHLAAGLEYDGANVIIPAEECTFYIDETDTIYLCADGVDDKSPDDVAHEYGHFLMDKAYGDSFQPGPDGAGIHDLCEDGQAPALSWSEGWANFFGTRANQELPQPGADGDRFYSRPAGQNTQAFSIDMEGDLSDVCEAVPQGQDNEMNVAMSLWDLRDNNDEAFDRSSAELTFIADGLEACDDHDYHDYYNIGQCSWTSRGGSQCDFVRTAWQNRIWFNSPPIVSSITTQASYEVVKDVTYIGADFTDHECGVQEVFFYASHDETCDYDDNFVDAAPGDDLLIGSTHVLFDTIFMQDDDTVWTCAQAYDGLRFGAFRRSKSAIGIDNVP